MLLTKDDGTGKTREKQNISVQRMGFSPNWFRTLPRFSRFARFAAAPHRAASTFRAVTVSSDALLPPPPFKVLPVKSLASLVPDKGEVILSVRAAAVNFPDLLICQASAPPWASGEGGATLSPFSYIKPLNVAVPRFVGDSSTWCHAC